MALLVSGAVLAVISIPLMLIAIGVTTFHLSYFCYRDGRYALTINPNKVIQECEQEYAKLQQTRTQAQQQCEQLRQAMIEKRKDLQDRLSETDLPEVQLFLKEQAALLENPIASCEKVCVPRSVYVATPSLWERLFPISKSWDPIVIDF